MPWYTWLKRLKNSKNVGSVKSQVLLLFDIFNMGEKYGAVHKTKIFCDETKILLDILDSRSLTGDYNCIDNYKYYYSIIEKKEK